MLIILLILILMNGLSLVLSKTHCYRLLYTFTLYVIVIYFVIAVKLYRKCVQINVYIRLDHIGPIKSSSKEKNIINSVDEM